MNTKKTNRSTPLLIFSSLLLLNILSCATEKIHPQYSPDNSYSDYVFALQELGMDSSRIGEAWIQSGEIKKAEPLLVATPFSMRLLLDPREPQAAFFLVEGVRGHRLDIFIQGPEGEHFFLDVFRLPQEYRPQEDWEESLPSPWSQGLAEQAASAGGIQSGASSLSFEPTSHRFYLVRLQTRLLEGGEFSIQILADAALAWPVPGTTHREIWSVFGAARDGGARVHHGVDIFAPRDTPLLSVSETSQVIRVGTRERGGLIVTLHDPKRDINLYYAHLETQEEDLYGQEIPVGTKIGTMGNTGNALTTPPHLHLGIYQGGWRGPVDPWYFIVPLDTTPPSLGEPPSPLGTILQPRQNNIRLRTRPPGTSSILRSPAVTDGNGEGLPPSAYPLLSIPEGNPLPLVLTMDTPLLLIGVTGQWAKVQGPEGTRGFAPITALRALGAGTAEILNEKKALLADLKAIPRAIAFLSPGEEIMVRGSYGNSQLVQNSLGQMGWIP